MQKPILLVSEEKENSKKEAESVSKSKGRNGRVFWKILLGFLLIGILVSFSFARVTGYFAGQLIKDTVEEYSEGIYTVAFDNLRINWRSNEITLDGFTYEKTDSNAIVNTEISFSANSAVIDLETISGIYFEKALHVESFALHHPKVTIHQLEKETKKQTFSFKTGNYYKIIEGFVKSFEIDDFQVTNLYLDYSKNLDKPVHYIVNDLSFSIHNFLLDSLAIEQKSDFFFTESVDIILKNQTLDMGDGIHQMHFDSLVMSTSSNNMEAYNVVIDSVSNPKFDSNFSHWNHYKTKMPYIGVIGLNFLKAYTDNVLEVDSVVFDRTDVSAILGAVKKQTHKEHVTAMTDSAVSNGVVKLLLDVFDKYELKQLQINHANANLFVGNQKDTAQIHDLNLAFTGFVLDSSDLIEEIYYPDFQGLRMDVAFPKFEIPNGDKISAAKLEMSTYDSSIIITDVSVLGRKGKTKRARDIKVASIELLGVQPKQILLENEIYIETINIKRPVFKLVNSPEKKQSMHIDMQLFLTDKISSYKVNRVNITHGKVNLNKGRNEIGGVHIYLDNFVLNAHSLQQNRFLLSNRSRIEINSVKVGIPQSQHDLSIQSLIMDSRGGKLTLKNWKISPNITDSKSLKFIAQSEAEILTVNGIDFNHLRALPKIDISQMRFQNVDAKINFLSHESEPTDTNDVLKKFLKGLEMFQLAHVEVDSVDVLIQKDGASVLKFSKGFFDSELLVADSAELANGNLVLWSDSTQFGVERVMLPLKKNHHMVNIESIVKTQDSSLMVKGFSLRPSFGVAIPDTLPKIVAYIPQLSTSNFSILGHQTLDTLSLGEIHLQSPNFKVTLPAVAKQQSKPFQLVEQLPNDFMDALFKAIKIEGVSIHAGAFELKKDSLELQVHSLDLYSENLEISKSSTWSPDRFLYAADFGFQLKDLSLQLPGVQFCHYVDSINYSFSPNALDVYGVYFNNREGRYAEKKTQLSLYLPKISMNRPNIYAYLTDSSLIIDEIISSHGFVEADIVNSVNSDGKGFKFPTVIPDYTAFKSIQIHDVKVNKMDVQLRTHGKDRITPLEMDHFNLEVDSFHIVPGETVDSNRLFWANDVRMSVKNVYTTVDEGLYELGADKLMFSSKKRNIQLDRISFTPTVPRFEYALHKGSLQKDVFDVNIKKVSLLDFRFDKLVYDQRVEGSQVWVEKPLLNIFKDKRNDVETDVYKDILPEVFKKVALPIYFDSVQVDNMKIRYEEFPNEGRKEGVIKLTRTNIKATNFTNDTVRLQQDSVLRIVMHSKFLDTADLYLELEYQMLTPDNKFTMYSTLGSMDPKLLNGYIEPCYSAIILSGEVHKMTMKAAGNDSLAIGNMGLFYEDLKFQFIDLENRHARKFRSWIGNTVVNSKNKYSYFKKPQDIFYERNTEKGWINYLVRIQLLGIQANAGIKKKQGKEARNAGKEIWKAFNKSSKKRLKVEGKLQKKKDREARKAKRKLPSKG